MANENNEEVRKIGSSLVIDKALGPLQLLPGKWRNLFPMGGNAPLPGRGWNMIALPFPEGGCKYRLLLNQYNEELNFNLVDKGVANRGQPNDQFVAALDYEQTITQIAADEFVDGKDFPASGKTGDPGLAIHHEPGLFLYMPTETTNGINIARTASIPHGDSVMAFGTSSEHKHEKPDIENINGLPRRILPNSSLEEPEKIVDKDQDPKQHKKNLEGYVAPYQNFHDHPFQDLFDPTQPNELLKTQELSLKNNKKIHTGIPEDVTINHTTKLDFNTETKFVATGSHTEAAKQIETKGGIINIPFIVQQANATKMHSIFWIVDTTDNNTGERRLFLQYSQTILLDFNGDIWPHVSINTLEKML